MYDRELVPLALNHGISEQTLEIARALCNPGGQITALHVCEVPQGSVGAHIGEDTVQKGNERASEILREKTAGLGGIKVAITRGQPYHTIINHAVEHKFGCIVIGSHKPGLSDFLIGSTAARVVRHAPCAVHVHRDS